MLALQWYMPNVLESNVDGVALSNAWLSTYLLSVASYEMLSTSMKYVMID